MSRWVDVRLPADCSNAAVEALVSAHRGLTFRIDFDPFQVPSMPRQIEMSVQDIAERDVLAALERAGVRVLASRSRLAGELTAENFPAPTAHTTAHGGPDVA